jgi:3-oxoacyl-[acyl-carrier protein] reductase
MRLAGKVAIVTGAASGIGRATLRRFVAEGAQVVGLDRDGEAVAREASEAGGEARGLACDVAHSESVEAAFAHVMQAHGRLDVVAHFAGITRDALIEKMTVEDFDLVLRVNLTGSFLIAQAAARRMTAAGAGSIVLTSSRSYFGNVGQANYAASKGGVVSLTRTLALELGKHNVRVNALAPGFIETPMTDVVPDKLRQRAIDVTPLRRVGRPEEIAAAALFLASDESGFITGQVLCIDGGRTVGLAPA